jgi:hypothetical protein
MIFLGLVFECSLATAFYELSIYFVAQLRLKTRDYCQIEIISTLIASSFGLLRFVLTLKQSYSALFFGSFGF